MILLPGMSPSDVPLQVGQEGKGLATVHADVGALAGGHMGIYLVGSERLSAGLTGGNKGAPVRGAYVMQEMRSRRQGRRAQWTAQSGDGA